MPGLLKPGELSRLAPILAGTDTADRDLVERLLAALPERSEEVGENLDVGDDPTVRSLLEDLLLAKGRLDLHLPYGEGGEESAGAVIVARHGLAVAAGPLRDRLASPASPVTEDEQLALTADRGIRLSDHCDRVAAVARGHTTTLGLEEGEDLVLAARLHDLGKADLRSQVMLAGGDPWNRPDGPPLAKSMRPAPPAAWERAGLPRHWRHEALSVRIARADPRLEHAKDPGLV
ncbi:MAG TPA: hypothetical protein VNA04_03025, partial [Thermoanaerobaculia bacterium]|nr:hypothetical protein [Thermoanaerobaculia bacterium]